MGKSFEAMGLLKILLLLISISETLSQHGDLYGPRYVNIVCPPAYFQCSQGGNCISLDYKCDGKQDCADASDERECPTDCRRDQFICDNGDCLNIDQVCNQQRDCPNGEDERSCSCRPDEFRCTSGQCIPASRRCDGYPDCPQDSLDEANCPVNASQCSESEFSCNSGECVDLSKRCDLNADCFDQSDESGCPKVRDCTQSEFVCTDGSCIEKGWVCDGVSDCVDGSDEINCVCSQGDFACDDGACIHESLRCDSAFDCQDGSDERNCPCTAEQFRCRNGECVHLNAVCDRRPDCTDRSDEENCDGARPPPTTLSPTVFTDSGASSPYRCPANNFQCENGQCIGFSSYCDGVFDCQDLSDEVNCPEPECQFGQFRCDSGECIESSLQCNNEYDCPDATDELDCDVDTGIRPYSNCGSFEFECNSGECVSLVVKCDGRSDCFDGSDESNCRDNVTTRACDDREFSCGDGSCISLFAVCDGRFDCRDYTDEDNCNEYSQTCGSSEFRCGDGQCVSSIVRCDGRYDCIDASDERDCAPVTPPPTPTPPPYPDCAPYEFRCFSGDCISAEYKCDGNNDCRDTSDEANCPVITPRPPTPPPRPAPCSYYEFTCRNGDCIDSQRQCDRNYDCIDRSDEENCPDDSFICYNGQKVAQRVKCDGRRDCADGSDEYECRPQPPYPTQPSDSLHLETYPTEQSIKQSREVVFQCRDEGRNRAAVRWVRAGGQRLPPGSTDNRGRLTMPNIQVEHSGTYYCEAQGVPQNSQSRKAVSLTVIPFQIPTVSPRHSDCSSRESTCRSGECIPKGAVCDGDVDCEDGSDESRCDPLGCEPNEFQCDNKQCVGKAWLCDSDDDCSDGSDERDCDGPGIPGSSCTNFEFSCQTGDQCIPRSFHCDTEIDCQDGSDEFGCSSPTIIQPPIRTLMIDLGETFSITCKAVGVPTPIVIWRLNWGHVPPSCTMTSEQGYGVLTCVSAKSEHQGAYSCEAINILESVFAEPDTIVQVKRTDAVCPPPKFNAGAITTQDCLNCFCFGITDQCFSTEMAVSQLALPMSEDFKIVGVNQDQFEGNYVIRDRKYPLLPRNLRPLTRTTSVQLEVRDRNRLAGPSDLIIYFSLPDTHKGSQLTAYGGYLRYTIQFGSTGGLRLLRGPDVILRGNNVTIMHVHDYEFEANRPNEIDVRFWPGNWYKRVINRGGRIQSQEPASRYDILTVLEDVDLILIRASYVDGSYIDTTLSKVLLDSALHRQTNQGPAVFVEECICPTGYSGLSCENCAENYQRTDNGPYLGQCVLDVACGLNEYGDPAREIPCLPCPCPLTNPANQFSQSCYLDSDGQVTCNCERGYQGRRCEACADGYEGNPTVPGDSCQPAGECDAKGSISLQPDPITGLCQCKDYVTGPKCSQCQSGAFYLNENNQYGCINCFCMGITDVCTSSNWYRTEEAFGFISNTQGMQLVDQYQRNVFNNNLFTDSLRQELIFRTFSDLPSEVYYWKLPRRFLGDKVSAYGGNLTFTLRYMPAPGGQSSRNNAYDVEIYGNDVTLRYYSKQQLSPSTLETVSVPFYEQNWQRQDGQTANREHFLMALADLEYILIKATYTTNTQEVGLKEIRLATAAPRNNGQERAFAVEMCDCPTGYRGLSCEDCDVGFTRELSGLHLGTCERCNCGGYSDECDPESGVCFNCRDNRAGDNCGVCADGYYEELGGRCESVQPCNCDPRGSVSTQCYDRCQCKENVQGDECNICKDGNFFLSEKNPQGCLSCWCSGVTNRCSSSQYYREQIPMHLFEGHGFTLADRRRTNVIKDGFETEVLENRISFNRFAELSPHTTFYWSLPQMFTGNRLTSYGGQLSITQSFESQLAKDIYADADVIITTSDQREFIWMNSDSLKPGRTQNYSVALVESEFTVDQRPASRSEFMAALATVEAILIRAQFSVSMVSTSIQYVTMDSAVDYQTGQVRASDVEQCSCPMEYLGFSCEECAQGYFRDLNSNQCLRCPCNGKEESCDAERNGNVVCNCLPGFSGPNCGLSVDRPPITNGVLEILITEPIYETEVGAKIELICRVSFPSRVTIEWDREGATLPYGRASDNREGTLTISQVRQEDAGTYICRASTGFHVSEERTELYVTDTVPASRPIVRIEETREEVEVSIGQYFEVRCRASGSPSPQVIWLRADGQNLSPTVDQQNGVLVFRNPQSTDSGVYICQGSNVQGTTEATIKIYVGEQYRPPAPDRPEDYIIVQVSEEEVQARPGEVVKVTCIVPNTAFRATITWTREQGELPQKSSQSDGQLIIPDARPVDSGLYTCRVSDNTGRFGEATTRINIAYYGTIPEVRIDPDRQTVNQGTTAQIRCIATGEPQPTITWSKSNEDLSPNTVVDGDVLRIENAMIQDRGMYICDAKNDVGDARTAAIIEVERREPPVVEMYPESRQMVERGLSVMFQCLLTSGIPTPSLSWARADGRPMPSNSLTLSGGVLRFDQVTGEEEGSYICTAENDAGKMTSTATLEIQAIPVITLRPANSPLRVHIGKPLSLECQSEGDPLPAVTWQKLQANYQQDIPGRSLSPSRSVFEVQRATLNDQGTYQCTATNAVGSTVERIQVLVIDSLPQYPTDPYPNPQPRPPYPQPLPDNTEAYQIPLGGDFQFRCYVAEIAGYEEDFVFTFERGDGRPLPRDHTEVNGVLTVSNVGRDAQGEYACIIKERTTLSVLVTIHATVEVMEQPRVRLEPARQVVRPGDTVSLRCIVTGAQPITINWSKETGSMPPSVIINDGELLFRGIATTDTGRYICEAINTVGSATSVAEVIVNERPMLTALQPTMAVGPGQNVDLRCEASGINPASIQWSLEGRRGLPPNAYSLPSESVLRITNVLPENAGRYKCEARTSLGVDTYDFITLTVHHSQDVNIRIRPSSEEVRVGEPIELYCDVIGAQRATVSWSRERGPLPYNARSEGRSLKIANVQPDNGGLYICTVTTASGVFEGTYPLAIQNSGIYGSRSVETRSTQFGSVVVLKCNMDLTPPFSFTWSKQGGQLPIRARINDDTIEIPEVQAGDAGTYICTGRNDEQSIDIPTLLIVTGVVPRFTGRSYIALPTLPDAYLVFDLEISFKADSEDGLIMYNSQRDGPGDFISFGLNEGYAEFRFDVGSGPATLRSNERLALDEWHTVKLSRNRKEGTMIVNNGEPVTGKSLGRFKGLDLINPLYIGGVPDISQINDQAGFRTGFRGCVSRLVIGYVISELMRDARAQNEIEPCDTCSSNPCPNGGVCQESYSPKGHKCICNAGFSGETCESTGESCYPGVCGSGKCVNIPDGLECFCPFGQVGPRCEHSISIQEPSFSRGAYMSYPTPRAVKRFSVGMLVKPQTMDDGIIMYCGQQERGDGDFTSLTIRNKRLEFKFNTGTGTAVLTSDEVAPGEWVKVRANRTDKLGSLQVNNGPMQNGESPGSSRSLSLRTPLFIGGVDRSKIEVAPDVQVSEGFSGCVSEIELMEQSVNIADSLLDSSNVDECGASPCNRNPCLNGGACRDEPDTEEGFLCDCPPDYSGPRCGSQEGGICLHSMPCHNRGVCQLNTNAENQCLCPLGFSGQLCEHESFISDSASFNENSWIEVDRYLLPQDGISAQEVTIEFSTLSRNGLLFWLGQDPTISGGQRDYLSIGIMDGYLEFTFHMDQEVVTARSEQRVNNGERHTVIVTKNKSSGSLQLDEYPRVLAEGSGSLFSFNTLGNIYIGGTPDLHRMTGSKYGVGFSGCIHSLQIGSNAIENFMDFALQGVNVSPCPSSHLHESGANTIVESPYSPSVIKHTSITTKRKTVTSRKVYHG